MTLTLYAHFCHFLPLFVNDFQDFKVSKFQSSNQITAFQVVGLEKLPSNQTTGACHRILEN